MERDHASRLPLLMAIKYFKPNLIRDDDDYLNTVFRYGDTVSQAAQKKALDHYGIKASFHQNVIREYVNPTPGFRVSRTCWDPSQRTG